MIARHGATARANKAIMIPLSGFDSVPSDAGALFCINAAKPARLSRVTAIAHARGALSGGTVATAALMSSNPEALAAAGDPLLLVPGLTLKDKTKRVASLPDGEWPSRIPQLGPDAWSQPHMMAPINTRVVRQSAALYSLKSEKDAYSKGPFSYTERALARGHTAAISTTIISAALGAALSPLCAPLVRRFLPAPGQGPSDEETKKNWFKLFFICEKESDTTATATATPLIACVSGGDPYIETGHSLAETGLLLAEAAREGRVDQLSGASFGYGFLTPATGLGLSLIERLNKTGWKFEIFNSIESAITAAAPRRV